MNSDDKGLSFKARLRRDLNELRETFNSQQSELEEQLTQLQLAHSDLDKAGKTLEYNLKEHVAQAQLAQSQNETKLAKLTVKLKDYEIQALEARLRAKPSNYRDKKSKSESTDVSVDSNGDGDANISLVNPPRRTDKTPESGPTPIDAPVNEAAHVFTCFICPKRRVFKKEINFVKHQQTMHMQGHGDKNIDVNVASDCSNAPAAKKRKKTVTQETDTNDSQRPSSSKTTSESSDPAKKKSSIRHRYFIGDYVSSLTSLQTFPCPICQKTFGCPENLQLHKELHLNEDMVQPSHWTPRGGGHKRRMETESKNHCEEEPVSFHDNENQNDSPPTSHPRADQQGIKLRPWNCRQCYLSFLESLDLQQHITKEHKFVDNICKVCSRSFSNEGRLQQHMVAHPGCGLCSNTFIGSADISRHFAIAHKNFKFQIVCSRCVAVFWNTHHWFVHKLICVPKPQ